MDLSTLRALIGEGCSTVFLGGAGVSTASGIPDFRSPSGLAEAKKEFGVGYETILSHSYFFAHPKSFYSFYWKSMVYESAKPNKAHRALFEFGKTHPLRVITQNIDGLHELAGSPNVLPLHGSVYSYSCTRCRRHYFLNELAHDGVPHCSCGALIRPDVVLYGEPLDQNVLEAAVEAVSSADLLIVGGTSLNVSPANALPSLFHGKASLLINKEKTPMDEDFDVVIREDVGDVLEELLR
ncbi:MAG: NAD-dependent protein deacylase [Candidatus Enteromonas sp.]|nr:NAD-dependent protein deacylase [Candidatus Enteromonas sp.]